MAGFFIAQMAMTVAQILKRVAAFANGEATAPTAGTDEFNQWMEFLDQAQTEYAEAYDWDAMRTTIYATGAQSGTSVGLPANFKKLDGFPIILGSQYGESRPEEAALRGSSQKYVTLGGNSADGYYMTVSPALPSAASMNIPIYAKPTSLSTTTQNVQISNPNYLVQSTLAKIFEQREDPRFQIKKADATLTLQQMIENEVTKFDQYANIARDHLTSRGFQIGRDG